MHFEFLVEEPSMEIALENLVPRIIGGVERGTWRVHNYGDKPRLLEKLPERIRAYARWIPEDYRIVVLVDEDRQDCRALKRHLEVTSAAPGLPAERVLIRIVVEELEAWYFGDPTALHIAYPRLPKTLEKRSGLRDPDAIKGGTWEKLDRELRTAGYREGLAKGQAARLITPHMDPDVNRSHSFQVFRDGLRRLADCGGDTAN